MGNIMCYNIKNGGGLIRKGVFYMKNSVRLALIGVGTMGKRYAEMLEKGIEGLELAAAVARSEANRNWIAENTKCKAFASVDELFENGALFDAVLIVTPHRAHPEIAIKAFEAGKHVMCDKPAGISVTDAEKMLKAARASGKKYGMMFHNRTYPVLKKLKELLLSGRIGDVKRIILENTIYFRTKAYHDSGSSWTGEGGGALINQGQHILDYWQWLFGMPESIFADVKFGKYNDFTVDDEVTIVMDYKNNVSGIFILTTGEAPVKEELAVTGSKGKITLSGDVITVENHADSGEYGKTAPTFSREGIEIKREKIVCEEAKEPYIEMLENFRDAVLYDKELIAGGIDGLNTLMLTNGAYMSAWLGKRVSLPIDGKLYDELLLERAKQEEVK